MEIRIFDVEHGAAAMIYSRTTAGIVLIDCGHNSSTGWTPADCVRGEFGKDAVDYLVISNADQDHYSNLSRLSDEIGIRTLQTNPTLTADIFEALKIQNGPLSADAKAYASLKRRYTAGASVHFEDVMGGIYQQWFWCSSQDFEDFNNLSLVTFYTFSGFTVMFPGDIEGPAWQHLIRREDFRAALRSVTLLVAPHHGRDSGYYREAFAYLQPRFVVISDKPIVHQTQVNSTSNYRQHVAGGGVIVYGKLGMRQVLTTRSDGTISVSVYDNGSFTVKTEC